jgi:Type IV secretion system pilin
MKKMLIASTIIILLGFAPSVLAQTGFVPLAPIPGLTEGVVANQTGLANFFNNLYKYLIGLAATLAVIMIIWGGIEIAINKDNVSKITDSKGKIYNAVFGLVLVLSPVLVFSIINPAILNLSINLPPLDTKSGLINSGATGGTFAANNTARAAGCNVVGLVLKTAYCPTQQAAQEFATSCTTGTGKVLSSQSSDGPCAAWQQKESVDAYTSANRNGVASCITYPATCSTVAGAFVFLDTSSRFSIDLFSDYQPFDSSGGASLVSFASSCVQEGGTTCIDRKTISTDCSPYTQQRTLWSKRCYNAQVSCESKSLVLPAGLLCSSSPSWVPVQ